MDDSDVVESIQHAKDLGLVIHITGTDENPSCYFTDKKTGKRVGSLELNQRVKKWRLRSGQ